MVDREAAPLARTLAREFKIVAIIGPRQAGKTTLARAVFAAKPYASLEDPDLLSFAQEDPRRFLALYPGGAVIDEAQRCPELFSYLQGVVDRRPEPGQFVLTGSQHFGLVQRITQSLAGRVGFVNLLPFSAGELQAGGWLSDSLDETLLRGGYPPIFDMPAAPERWYNAYLVTYAERDVRQLRNVQDLATFQRMLRLCAGAVGQLADLTRIGNDAGVDQKTVRAWLNVLEASFILFRLPPHERNFRKRLVRTPKLYFYDTGLAARLIGIESAAQLSAHPLRGALFENWVITEFLKGRWNAGRQSNLSFWRSHGGLEIDLLLEQGQVLAPVEVKSGATVSRDWFKPLRRWRELAGDTAGRAAIVYGGDQAQQRSDAEVVPWRRVAAVTQPNAAGGG